MRAAFGIVGLLVVLAILGLLARKQLAGNPVPPAAGSAPATAIAPAAPPTQQVDHVRQSVDALMQAPRAVPDDAK